MRFFVFSNRYITFSFLLGNQVVEPPLLRNQVHVFVDFFLQVFDLSSWSLRYLVKLCNRQDSVFLISIKILENFPPSVEIRVDNSPIPIYGKAVGEDGFYFLVPFSNVSFDAALFELLPIVVIGHSIIFEFLCVEGYLADWLEVTKVFIFVCRLHLELLVCQKFTKHLLFTHYV